MSALTRVPKESSVCFHLFFDAVSQLFDLLRLFYHIQGESVFVGFVHILLQLGGQFKQVVRVAMQLSPALTVRLLGHVFFELYSAIVLARVGIGWLVGVSGDLDWALTKRRSRQPGRDQQKRNHQHEGFDSHNYLGNNGNEEIIRFSRIGKPVGTDRSHARAKAPSKRSSRCSRMASSIFAIAVSRLAPCV